MTIPYVTIFSHDMFISEVLAINAEASLVHPRTGAFQLSHADPICYAHGRYFALGRLIGTFGYSVRKKKQGTGRSIGRKPSARQD